MNIKNYFFALLLSFSFYGCAILWFGAGAGIGITGYKYLNGQLEFTCSNSMDQVYKATKLAFKSLKIELLSEYRDALEAKITGIRGNGDKVKVKLKNIENNNTWVGIRVGVGRQRSIKYIKK